MIKKYRKGHSKVKNDHFMFKKDCKDTFFLVKITFKPDRSPSETGSEQVLCEKWTSTMNSFLLSIRKIIGNNEY